MCVRVGLIFELLLLLAAALNDANGQGFPECEPVKLKVYIDGAAGLERTARQQFLQNFKYVFERLPANSKVDLKIIGKEIENIDSVTVPDHDGRLLAELLAKLNRTRLQDSSGLHGTISSEAIDQDLLSYFIFGKFKSVSELVFLFVSSSSVLNGLPKSLLKKKSTVVIFGESASQQWRAVACRKDHLFVVNSTADLRNIGERLINTTCKDSMFYCDTDEFSTSKGAGCRKCAKYVCQRHESLTCKSKCPYYRKPVSENATEKVINDKQYVDVDGTGALSAVNNNSKTLSEVVLVVLCGLIASAALVGVFIYNNPGNQRTLPHHDIEMRVLSRRNREREERNMQQNGHLIPESVAQQETHGATGGGPDLDEELAASLLKNDREREINILATEPPIHDVQAGK